MIRFWSSEGLSFDNIRYFMQKIFIEKLKENEIWLMERILWYATEHNYTQYTSTLTEAWRASIEGITYSLEKYANEENVTSINSNFDKSTRDPSTEFGKIEAIRHRDRGISISLFMGLFKYYRKTYEDFIRESFYEDEAVHLSDINTFFDKVEIAFIDEWISKGDDDYRKSLLEENTKLANEKNKFLTIFESLHEPVFVFDAKNELIHSNFEASLLSNPDAVPGADYYSEKRAVLPDYLKPIVEEAILSDKNIFTKTLDFEQNGEYFYYELLFTRLLDVSSKFKGLCMIVNDISDIKRVEKELIKLNETLTVKVDEETQKNLKNERLILEQKKISDLGNIVNAIAHQWKQPLNSLGLSIQSVFQMIDDGLPKEDIHEYEERLNSLVNYMSDTIDDFRSFMTPDKEKEYFSVKNAVEDSIKILESQLDHNCITYSLDFDDNHLIVYGSISELKQVLLNIIANSKDALEQLVNQKRKHLNINIFQDENYITIKISDNAGGIPDKLMDKVFFPYFTTKSKGTGIGLYMSKVIIEDSFHGKLFICNENDGASVSILLPKPE
ncbi:MAG: hypothetical protein C0603_03390 [Denitrovibrio sp.]|nr:MAG: hypothetical protein C0603_03390 [Denitrovibrio sp.]